MAVKKLKESSNRSTFNYSGYSFEEIINSSGGLWWVSIVPEDFDEDYEAYSEDGESWLILKNGDEVGQERSDDRKEVADILIQYAGLEEGVKNKMAVKKLKERIEESARVSSTSELMDELKRIVKKYNHMELTTDLECRVVDDRKGRRLQLAQVFGENLIKEGYSDCTVSTSEIMDAINALEELVEMMDDAGIDSIHASSNTYGLGQHFIGFPGGFINYHDVYSYVGGNEDEEYYDDDEDVDEGWH